MNEIVPGNQAKPIKTRSQPSRSKSNVFKQLMYAKNELALQLVEDAQDNWGAITGVLMGKALEGDMRAMALLLDYVIEKAPQKFQIQSGGVDISNLSMDDLMRIMVSYDSIQKAKKETIMGEAEEIESQFVNQAPPPPENCSGTQTQNIQMEKATDVLADKPIPD